jgi:hypothetical protein
MKGRLTHALKRQPSFMEQPFFQRYSATILEAYYLAEENKDK